MTDSDREAAERLIREYPQWIQRQPAKVQDMLLGQHLAEQVRSGTFPGLHSAPSENEN